MSAVVPGAALDISIGTTAPFSAISGASMTTSLLGVAPVTPRPLSASPGVLAPKASLFQAASAASGRATASASAASSVRRRRFMRSSSVGGAILTARPAEYPRSPSAFLVQPHLAERHAAIDGLHHVVDRQQSDRRAGERLHL